MKNTLIKRDQNSRVELGESENFKFQSEIKEAPGSEYSASPSPPRYSKSKNEIMSGKKLQEASIKNSSLLQESEKKVRTSTGSIVSRENKSFRKSPSPVNKSQDSSKFFLFLD